MKSKGQARQQFHEPWVGQERKGGVRGRAANRPYDARILTGIIVLYITRFPAFMTEIMTGYVRA